MLKGYVNRIIPFSFVDGPGNRSAVFLQGCDFSCKYCHNPETINMCSGCGRCVELCPRGALTLSKEGIKWNSGLCAFCDRCLKVCSYNSSPRVRTMTMEQVFEEIREALPFIEGITVSGGECTKQNGFVTELFREAHAFGKTAFADTNGETDFRSIPELTKEMDKAMLDIKSSDAREHIMLTGSSNETVIENARYLASIGKLYEIRTVVVPGFLDNFRTVDFASRLIAPYPEVRYKLIRFRKWGVRGPLEEFPVPDDSVMEPLKELALKNGVKIVEVI
ncbi:MAG: YjjW family glycine radical enzyme activase [Bacillota bacterium]|nr:YjjW family glycine radical enzyme activase [Bacillota bacterium]